MTQTPGRSTQALGRMPTVVRHPAMSESDQRPLIPSLYQQASAFYPPHPGSGSLQALQALSP